jgi:hypothetical protein
MDQLSVLDFDTSAYVPPHISHLIHLRQRNLTSMVSYRGENGLEKTWVTGHELRNITTVKLHIANQEDIERGRFVLEHTPLLQDLGIQEDYPFGVSDDRLLAKLFHSWLDTVDIATRKEKLQLKRLVLQDIPLHEDISLDEIIVMETLDCFELRGEHWAGCEELMEMLAQKTLRLTKFHDSKEYHANSTLALVVRSLRGIRELHLKLFDENYLPVPDMWETLKVHGSSLRTLSIADTTQGGVQFPVEPTNHILHQFRALCAVMPNLEQLAVQSPQLERAACTQPSDLTVTQEIETFGVLLHSLQQLPSLKSLRLFIYLKDLETPSAARLAREEEIAARMQLIASRIFDELHTSCASFGALLFDVRTPAADNFEYMRADFQTYAYLRALNISATNQARAVAQPIDKSLLKHYEPCSELLYEE